MYRFLCRLLYSYITISMASLWITSIFYSQHSLDQNSGTSWAAAACGGIGGSSWYCAMFPSCTIYSHPPYLLVHSSFPKGLHVLGSGPTSVSMKHSNKICATVTDQLHRTAQCLNHYVSIYKSPSYIVTNHQLGEQGQVRMNICFSTWSQWMFPFADFK